MNDNGIIEGRAKGKVALRIRSMEPYSAEFTAAQIGVLADIAEQYGSGAVHFTPRQTVEIPHIDRAALPDVTALLVSHGLFPGSSGRHLRNVTACSRWCLYNAWPMSDAARKLNALLNETVLPGKTNISLSGCEFSCVRSRTSDIGVIARTEIVITDKKCKQCSLCIKDPLGCQVDAITLTGEGVEIDRQKCVRCGFCSGVCRPGAIGARSKRFDILVGGNGGVVPREALLHSTVSSEEEAIKLIGSILGKYTARALNGERLGDVIARVGMKGLEV
jgi:anaerobic sulfite reductase subunit C